MSTFDDNDTNSGSHSGAEPLSPPPLPSYTSPIQLDLASTLPKFDRTPRFYFTLLSVGVLTGIASNIFLGGAPGIGINLFLVMLVFFGGWFLLSGQKQVPLWRKLCGAAALLYYLAMALRASEVLFAVNIMLALGFTGLACTAAYAPRMRSIWATIIDLIQVGFNVLLGSILVIFEAPWNRLKVEKGSTSIALRVLKGLLIAAPFLLVFGFLFSRAEVRFGLIFDGLFTLITTTLFSNFWVTFWGTLFALGLLRGAFLSISLIGDSAAGVRSKSFIGLVESVTVLSLLNAMFLIFVITQLPYLFGGQGMVTNTPNLGWSEYARSGFFELAWVAALLIPTLMLFMNSTTTVTPGQKKLVQALCGGLTLLAGIVIMSALQRMLLYTSNYGLTEMRVYVSTFIVMLAIILILLNVFSITGRNQLFLPAALAVGFLFSMGIQIPNVQGMVASDIVTSHLAGKASDMHYLSRLSPDAIPAINKSGLPASEKIQITEAIISKAMKGHSKPNWLYQPLSVLRK